MIIRRKNNNESEKQIKESEVSKEEKVQNEEIHFENIDISSIEFKERLERRRGERRRGFRRINERSLVSRAQEEAQSIRDNAREEGYKQGVFEAKADIEEMRNSIESLLDAKNQVLGCVSKDILELGVEVAKKIIKREVMLDDDILSGILSEVIDKVSLDEQKITIKVENSDLEYAQQIIPKLLEQARIDAKVVIVPDDEIEKGSCVLIVSNGVVDANFKTQIKLVENAFEIYR